MRTSELDYELPPELIAQHPPEGRDESRLLVYDRETRAVRHRRFAELPDELSHGELVVVNDTRVLPARIRTRRASGGAVEVLLLEPLDEDGLWEGLARPSRPLRPGERLGPVELVEPLGEGRWRLRLEGTPSGEMPLPPYITEPLGDPERYQTVYSRDEGSAAAPTAGLHFTTELLERLDVERVTLHVGLDTFRPVASDRLEGRLTGTPGNDSAAAYIARRFATLRLKAPYPGYLQKFVSRSAQAAHTGDTAARVGARSAQVKAGKRHPVIGMAEHRPGGEELVQAHLAVENIAAHEPVCVIPLRVASWLPRGPGVVQASLLDT